MDITFDQGSKKDLLDKNHLAPVEALKEMTKLGHTLRSVSYQVLPSEDRVYSANLTVRFNNPD